MRKVYLDHNATTPVHPQVLEAMLPYYKGKFGNPSSIHESGRVAKTALEEAREEVAKLFNCSPYEIYFTSGGTEADNLAIKGVAFANKNKGKHIITSSVEHHAVLESCKYLKREGYEITPLPVDRFGLVNPEDLKKNIREGTILITIMHVNNETGTIEPLQELARIAEEKDVYFHTDAVQSAGKIPIDVEKLPIDLASISGHKIYGPKGVGAIYIRKGTRISPLSHGGHHERSRRAGTENIPGIVGLGEAVKIALKDMDKHNKHLKNLTETFFKKLRETVKDVQLNGHPEKRIASTLNISFKGIEGESIILSLDMKGVSVASGSACTSGSLEPSHVLSAMDIEPAVAQSSIRFGFGRENTTEDVDYVISVLPQIIQRLRSMSPIYAQSKK